MAAKKETKNTSGIKLPFELGSKINQSMKQRLIDAAVDGFGTLFMNEELVGRIMDELRLPREWLSTILSQTEKARKNIAEILKNELRKFLEGLDLQKELTKILTSMILEVKTEIRFVPTTDGGVQERKKSKFSLRRITG